MVREAKSRSGRAVAQPPRPSPISSIAKIGSLNRFPDKEYANDLLHQVVKLVAPIIHERKFKVGTLCEMYPKSANLLGLNVNRGQKILLRLRYHSNERLFLPLGDIIGTFLHELTHNLYGPHDTKFYRYLDDLKAKFELMQVQGARSGAYVCEEERLGGGTLFGGFVSERQKRLQALGKVKYVGSSGRLGTLAGAGARVNKRARPSPETMRRLILEAADRRAKDSKWCVDEAEDKVQPADKELDIVDVDCDEPISDYTEVIDLTKELDEREVVVVNACASRRSILKKNKAKRSSARKVTFGLLPSMNDDSALKAEYAGDAAAAETSVPGPVYYVTSSSPRTFIADEVKYPRRKLVANLNFGQIMSFKEPEIERKPNGDTDGDKGAKATPEKATPKPCKARMLKKRAITKKRTTPTPIKQDPKTVRSIEFSDLV